MFNFLQEMAENSPDRRTGGPSVAWLLSALIETRRLSRIASPQHADEVAIFGQDCSNSEIEIAESQSVPGQHRSLHAKAANRAFAGTNDLFQSVECPY